MMQGYPPMRTQLILVTVVAFVLGAAIAVAMFPDAAGRWLAPVPPTSGTAAIGGPFTLTDHHGKRVADTDFGGRYRLMFFGFTHCPDVCPTALQAVTAALAKLGPGADAVTPIFVSVDPTRDTPEALAAYLSSFDPRIVGLTGSEAEIAAVAKAYRVYAKKVADAGSADGYTIDHSALLYLFDRQGAYLTHFSHGSDPDDIAKALAALP
jgi:protein SCO1/2